ncbi:hypothetical protein C0389_00300 [bacterium]|nr:hypothetical protein [bacterium]
MGTTTPNKRFYERMIANLYSADFENLGSCVLRANNLGEAFEKVKSKYEEHDKSTGVNKLDLREDYISNLFETSGLIQLLISFEDHHNLCSNIYHSNGDYQFTLSQLHEAYLQQLQSMWLLIEKLQSIEEAWNLRCSSVELFLEEYKELRKDEADGFNENNIEEKNVAEIVSENAG